MDQLKLAALDVEDLSVISAHMQDAVLTVGDIRYLPKAGTVVLAVNRFVWDKEKSRGKSAYERRRSALSFARVKGMKASNIRQRARGSVLELLAIRFKEDEAPGGTVLLDFAGGGAIALEVECIEAQMADLGAAWETARQPSHELD